MHLVDTHMWSLAWSPSCLLIHVESFSLLPREDFASLFPRLGGQYKNGRMRTERQTTKDMEKQEKGLLLDVEREQKAGRKSKLTYVLKNGEREVGWGEGRGCKEGEPATQADVRHYACVCVVGGKGTRAWQAKAPEQSRIGENWGGEERSFESYICILYPLSCS